MHLSHLQKNFEKRRARAGVIYALGSPATRSAIEAAETGLGVRLPHQVSLFYRVVNGFEVQEPSIRVLDLESLERVGDAIRFSVVDRVHWLAFDVSEANEAVSGRSGTKQTATP